MSVNTNIADYLTQIENLTATNLQILKTINDSFFTKKSHLFAEIDNATYVIPSFLSLENKINMLQENFENLVKAPETGEAYFNFDGNTRAIEVRKYTHTPDSIVLNSNINSYSVEHNDVFKDFLTPTPYINLALPSLPDDIVEVNVKKVIAKSDSLKNLFKAQLSSNENSSNTESVKYKTSANYSYNDVHKILLNYVDDTDYVEYDTIYKLPIRKSIGTGTYIIEKVISDEINNNLEELITLKIRDKLTYKLFDETIEKPLQVGDELINYDGTGKVEITEIQTSTNTIVVKVVNGEYLNFVGTDAYDTNNDTDIHDLSKLRFYKTVSFEKDKYIKVPLEEDQYVFIAVAALNSRMNIQSSWGTGVIINTFGLTNNDVDFNTYYSNNVKNLGDVLLEMSNMITSPITSLSQEEFLRFTTLKPFIPNNSLSVMQINKHLNNSTTVQNIRDAYNQKKTAEMSLTEIQSKINDINEKLSAISFNDTSGLRPMYTSQLSQFNHQKNELLTTITNAINIISLNVNSAEVPIENAKYRIRGFYVPDESIKAHVIGLQVQYRYKNLSSETGNAVSLTSADNTQTYIYSDWNVLNTKNKLKVATFNNGIYTYNYENDNEAINEPSYNQIDIPISQGENVDIRIKVVYDFGQPYITMTSDWSEITTLSFPEEFTKDVPVLTIIEENNNDIETNRFNNILETTGVNNHINDMFMDQNVTFFHKPDTIASGFYTEERRVIPLKDKLQSMVNDIALLKSDVQGIYGNHRVGITVGNSDTEIYSDRDNIIVLEPYSSFNNDNENIDGAYFKNYNEETQDLISVSTILNISITNTSENTVKLYSIFPGNRNVTLNDSYAIRNNDNYKNYIYRENGVYFKYVTKGEVNGSICPEHCVDSTGKSLHSADTSLQTHNQFITFRINDAWTLEDYYTDETIKSDDEYDRLTMLQLPEITDGKGLVVYPYLNTKYGLCMDSDNIRTYMVINPGEEIIVPLYCEFAFGDGTEDKKEYKKTISFDLRTSLFSDPINYAFKVIAKYTATTNDRLTAKNKTSLLDRATTQSKYNHTIK